MTTSPANPGFFHLFPSIVLPMFLAVVDQTIVASALPAIAASLGNADKLSWIVVSYLVATTISAPVYGRLGDLLGRRRLILIALAIFAVGTILCAVSQSLGMLTAARVLQGAGGGGLMTLSQALVGESIPPRQRAHYQGYLAAVAVSASAFGPVAGGFLTEHFGWRSIFVINLPTILLAAVLVLRLPSSKGKGAPFRFDFWGFTFFAIFIAATLLALERGQSVAQGSWELAIGLAVVGALSLGLLIRQEGRVASPLLPLQVLRNPAVWRADLMAACHGATLVSLISFLPLYFRIVHGTSSARIGLLLLPLTTGIGLGSLVTGRIVARTGRSAIFPSVGMAVVTGMLVLVAVNASSFTEVEMAFVLGLISVFLGTVMGVVQVTVQLAAGAQHLGAGAATVQFSRSLGAAFGTAIVAAVLFTTLSRAGPGGHELFDAVVQGGPQAVAKLSGDPETIRAAISRAFELAFACTAVFAGINMVAAWSLPVRRI